LRAAGFEVDEAVVYETADLPLLPAAQAALDGTQPVIVPLFSPKSAQRAAAAMGGARAPLVVLSLSSAVDRAAAAIPAVRRLVARRPDADGMMEIMIRALNQGALS
jgi:uroporphyrinogen-III synthase